MLIRDKYKLEKTNHFMRSLSYVVKLAIGSFILLGFQQSVAAENVGTALLVKGPVAAQQPGDAARTLLVGDDIMQGDVLRTEVNSYVVIGFTDGAKFTVRPDTTFTVDAYASNSTAFDMVKGGVRFLTGKFTKDMPEGFRLQTPLATLGVRGTHATVRICPPNCIEDNQKLADMRPQTEDCEFLTIPPGLYLFVELGIVSVTQGDNEVLVNAGETVYVDENGVINSLCGAPRFLYNGTPNPEKFSGLQQNPSAGGGAIASPGGGASADPDAPSPPSPPEPITEPATPDLIIVEEPEEPRASPN